MTASSYFDRNYYPYYGRLNGSRGFGAWCTKTKADRTDYLQVDMGNEYSVCAVATQGPKNDNAWTTSYKIHFSSKAVTWNTYTDNNVDRVSLLTHLAFCLSQCLSPLLFSFLICCDFTTMFSDAICQSMTQFIIIQGAPASQTLCSRNVLLDRKSRDIFSVEYSHFL